MKTKRRASAFVSAVTSMLIMTPAAALPAEGGPITLESLLCEMIDRDALARWPEPSYTCRQASSYDRRSLAPQEPGWFANEDTGQYLRVETNGGRLESVMLDSEGPGCIVRWWTGSIAGESGPPGTVRVYLDQSATPAIEEKVDTLVSSNWLVGPPLAATRCIGRNFYLPIPFAKHCKITYDRPPLKSMNVEQNRHWYAINYRTYPKGAAVRTFTLDELRQTKPTLDRVQQILLTPGNVACADAAWLPATSQRLERGQALVKTISGSQAIRRLSVCLRAPDLAQALRSTVLIARFDDEQTVWCPVGDFFGSGVGFNPYRDWWHEVDSSGLLTCRWVMPFRESCRLELLNLAAQPVEATLGAIAHSPWPWDERSLHFHAGWRQQAGIQTKPAEGTMDWNYAEITGRGIYVGDALALHNGAAAWWGEGDEKVFVDGELFPSHFGTGSEDYYGYSLGDRGTFFEAPFHAEPRWEGNRRPGFVSVTRTRSLDAIPFMRSLKFDLEIWHWTSTKMTYAATTYWYARPGGRSNRGPAPDDAARLVGELRNRIPGVLEGEELRVQHRTGGVTEVQSDARWSGGQHLWWRDGKPGDQLELLLPVAQAGRYWILMHHCRAFDYGLLQFYLDGEKLGEPMDLYSSENINKLVVLGERNLKAGDHVFTAKIVGANPAAKPRHMFGLDYFQLAPVKPEDIKPKTEVVPASVLVAGLAGSRTRGGDEIRETAAQNEFPLGTLRFFESGTVRREMRFERRPIVAIFFETPDAWSSSWGGVYDRDHTIPYLFEIRRNPYPGAGSDIAFEDFDDILFTDVPEELVTPPLGMRSAVPLGGIGAGTVELRADGSLQDWNIFNNSPAGGRRVQLDEALLGFRADGRAWTLRTHPPRGLPGVSALRYAGAFPVSRLIPEDPDVPVGVELFAYSEFHVRDPERSATPAAIFTFRFRNPSDRAIEAAALFLIPNAIGGWFAAEEGLTLSKPGTEPDSGGLVIRPDAGTVSWGSAGDPTALWKAFAETGKLPGIGEGQACGALAASLELPPRGTRTVTFVLAWHFPGRTHAGELIGNRYAAIFGDAQEVAGRVLARLPETWRGIAEWQDICCDNSLPDWLRSSLLNSLANLFHTSIWARDGRYRQWEAFSCPNLHPMHIHFYRSLPFTLFFPSLQKDSLRGHARCQRDDGYIREDLGNARGWDRNWSRRLLGDGCTAFVLNVWMDFLWTGDRAFLDEIWPNAKRALGWQIDRAKALGLPERLCTTYDWWDFETKDVVAYNAFLHLAALVAGERMAEIEGDSSALVACREAIQAGRQAVDEKLWTGRSYRSIWLRGGGIPDALHTDTLYGQLWAYLLDLGHLADPARLRSHLALEAEVNPTPFGLKVFEVDSDRPTCRVTEPGLMPDHRNGPRDATVWQVGSLDWCSLNLYLGGPADRALEEARKVIDAWRLHLADPWNWTDTSAAWTGFPYGNSHYGRQLIFWSIPLALSGQRYSAPRRVLTFEPVLAAPARLPFFLPQACGVLELLANGSSRLLVLSGKVELAEVRLGARSPKRDVILAKGQSIEL